MTKLETFILGEPARPEATQDHREKMRGAPKRRPESPAPEASPPDAPRRKRRQEEVSDAT